jgi:hypothetical protein
MTDEPNKDSRSRFRSLISSGQKKAPALGVNSSPLARLPKGHAQPAQVETPSVDYSPAPPASTQTPPEPAARLGSLKFGPAFWTVASVLSLTINVVLIVVLFLVVSNLRRLSINLNNLTKIPVDLLGGLYTNFEKMDRAHITTTIPVETTIPVKFDLKLNQQTNVVLSQDVVINNALVTVQTGGLNITRALTTIVLPQGTTLPVILDLNVPVDTTVPVTLTVPIDISLENTQLHEPFAGLQEVVKPVYCLVDSSALNLSGAPICP